MTKTVDARTSDGRNWELLSPLHYLAKNGRVYRAPRGSKTDGISTPAPVWPMLAPFGKEITPGIFAGWFSGIMHDSAYRRVLQIYEPKAVPDGMTVIAFPNFDDDASWKMVDMTQAECDELIYECMEAEGFDRIEERLVYETLRAVGKKAYAEDRKALTESKVAGNS